MTRINCGIRASELCDQHLLAEYRELPRLFGARLVSKPPAHFTLGKGHVLWCAQYPRTMADRFDALVTELDYRGFRIQYRAAPVEARTSLLRAPPSELTRARPILIERITTRLATAKREPRWTRRDPPDWAHVWPGEPRRAPTQGAYACTPLDIELEQRAELARIEYLNGSSW